MAHFTSSNKRALRVLLVFFLGGLCSGLLFTWLVSRPSLQTLWFRRQEFWLFPTWKFWLLTGSMFLSGLVGPYALSHWKRWISFPTSRLLLGLILLVAVPVPVWLITQSLPVVQSFLVRVIFALCLSLALFAVTRCWHNWVGALMLMVCTVTPLIASIPHTFLQSFPNEWFEALKFVVASSLLSLLSGYWLGVPDEKGRAVQLTSSAERGLISETD
jgi:hypothetical protein